MDAQTFRDLPVLGDTLFCEPVGGWYGWTFAIITTAFTAWATYDRGPKVGLLAGGPLVLMAVPHLLPERRYQLSVWLRLLGIVWFVVLWIAILVYFPDAPTFFEGNW